MTIGEITERLRLNLVPDRDGYKAWCSDLPDCRVWGKTPTEAMSRLREAVEEYLERLRRRDPERFEELERVLRDPG